MRCLVLCRISMLRYPPPHFYSTHMLLQPSWIIILVARPPYTVVRSAQVDVCVSDARSGSKELLFLTLPCQILDRKLKVIICDMKNASMGRLHFTLPELYLNKVLGYNTPSLDDRFPHRSKNGAFSFKCGAPADRAGATMALGRQQRAPRGRSLLLPQQSLVSSFLLHTYIFIHHVTLTSNSAFPTNH